MAAVAYRRAMPAVTALGSGGLDAGKGFGDREVWGHRTFDRLIRARTFFKHGGVGSLRSFHRFCPLPRGMMAFISGERMAEQVRGGGHLADLRR